MCSYATAWRGMLEGRQEDYDWGNKKDFTLCNFKGRDGESTNAGRKCKRPRKFKLRNVLLVQHNGWTEVKILVAGAEYCGSESVIDFRC